MLNKLMEIEMRNKPHENLNAAEDGIAESDRRQFLSTIGKFSIATPPTIALLLSTSLTSQAIAMSGGRGNNGYGNGGGDGSPNSIQDVNR